MTVVAVVTVVTVMTVVTVVTVPEDHVWILLYTSYLKVSQKKIPETGFISLLALTKKK